ncbi:hypothetical protein JB92DRAFT_2658525, partial [Gautieria morchelliformis]
IKKLNLSTYKLHAMGDYVNTIRHLGTIDSYSTQAGELEHRTSKRRYPRAAKNAHAASMPKIDRCETHMRAIHAQVDATSGKPCWCPHPLDATGDEHLPYTDPTLHHHMSSGRRHPMDIGAFLQEHEGDPALKACPSPLSDLFQDFYPRLKDHILARVLGNEYDGDETRFTAAERNTIFFADNRLYRHQVLRVNFTTYNLRRSQDSFNSSTDHCDLMVLAREDPTDPHYHPFWYARLLAIFHVNVIHQQPDGTLAPPRLMHFLWIRWFGRDLTYRSSAGAKRLHQLGFVSESDDTEPFGFLDPANVIRAIHTILAFAHGRTTELLGPSIARRDATQSDDWRYYYVNQFADRDLLMRFMGGGIGH